MSDAYASLAPRYDAEHSPLRDPSGDAAFYEVEHLLARAGLEPLAFWGGFDRRPFDGKGEIVVVARA